MQSGLYQGMSINLQESTNKIITKNLINLFNEIWRPHELIFTNSQRYLLYFWSDIIVLHKNENPSRENMRRRFLNDWF